MGEVSLSTTYRAGLGAVLAGLVRANRTDPLVRRQGHLIMSCGYVALSLMSMLLHSHAAAVFSAALAAFLLWLRWNGGGGDGMKRRWKKWTTSPGPKTVPQGA